MGIPQVIHRYCKLFQIAGTVEGTLNDLDQLKLVYEIIKKLTNLCGSVPPWTLRIHPHESNTYQMK